jgi:nitrogen fixation protein NifB
VNLDLATLARIANHPCYHPPARLRAARMHLPVAARCNIQCGFCSRRYDCANEARPGVTSALLHPEDAAARVAAVRARLPQLAVIGIAGPGDPLANPQETFDTIDRVRAAFPDLTFCLSTNGLALLEHVEAITARGVEHVTITINAVDPDVGAQIYPWVQAGDGLLRGRAAAEHLLVRQQAGLRALIARGVLVKINTVLIPGVNDAHIPEVARFAASEGALILNIVPLIPVAGTAFASTPAPDAALVQAVRRQCAPYLRIMGHCAQCRADAIGFVGAQDDAEDHHLR